ncbi:MAG: TolC family protein [Gammaproteobacteria bacterium]
MPFRIILILLAAIVLAGCVASVPRDGEFKDVEQLLNERVEYQVHWYQGGPEDTEVREQLDELLQEPLTAAAAVQIGLLKNQRLQSEYEQLGIAQVDLVQAGLLSNPRLFGSIRFPSRGGGNNAEFELAQGFLDVLLRSARQRLARTGFERAKLSISQHVLDFTYDVLRAFREFQAAARLVEIFEIINESADAGYELARKFDAAGNLSELQLAQYRSIAANARAELVNARLTQQHKHDQLAQWLGLRANERNLVLAEALPKPAAATMTRQEALAHAQSSRLDLAVLRVNDTQLQHALGMTRDFRYVGGMEFGVNAERETDGTALIGPNISIELPLFDQQQARIARLESRLEQNRKRITALEVDIDSEVLMAWHRVESMRELLKHYQLEVLPASEQMLAFMQQEQNFMLKDVFDLLLTQREVQTNYHDYIKALRDYWIAEADLQRAIGLGGTVTTAEADPVMQPQRHKHNNPRVPAATSDNSHQSADHGSQH